MKTCTLMKTWVVVLWIGLLMTHSMANAALGYMAFLQNGPMGTTVVTGDAASYMRAGRDWDGMSVMGGVAMPTLLQESNITTWRDVGVLHFKFEIPDRTTTTNGAPLAC